MGLHLSHGTIRGLLPNISEEWPEWNTDPTGAAFSQIHLFRLHLQSETDISMGDFYIVQIWRFNIPVENLDSPIYSNHTPYEEIMQNETYRYSMHVINASFENGVQEHSEGIITYSFQKGNSSVVFTNNPNLHNVTVYVLYYYYGEESLELKLEIFRYWLHYHNLGIMSSSVENQATMVFLVLIVSLTAISLKRKRYF